MTPTQIGNAYSVISRYGGAVTNEQNRNNFLYILKGNISHENSNNFISDLRSSTSGNAVAYFEDGHWSVIDGSLQDQNSKLFKTVMNVRERKGLKKEIPNIKDLK